MRKHQYRLFPGVKYDIRQFIERFFSDAALNNVEGDIYIEGSLGLVVGELIGRPLIAISRVRSLKLLKSAMNKCMLILREPPRLPRMVTNH
jgi:hypothetical protein